MRKDDLRKLRALPATKEMLQKAKENSEYKMYLRIQNLNKFIKIAVFLPAHMKKDINTPRYEIFLNVVGEEFITRELDKSGNEVRWSSAMIQNLDGPDRLDWWYYSTPERNVEAQTFINADAKATMNRLPLQKDNGSKGVSRIGADIELFGRKYRICFTVRAIDLMQEQFGCHIAEILKMLSKDNPETLLNMAYILAVLVNERIRSERAKGSKPLTNGPRAAERWKPKRLFANSWLRN